MVFVLLPGAWAGGQRIGETIAGGLIVYLRNRL
jgi:hypothetical protein